MKLVPNGARVLVKPIEESDVRVSGIVVPEVGKVKPIRGEVLAIGPGDWNSAGTARIPLAFEVGQVVVFDRYSGLEYRTDRTAPALLLLRAHDVLATEVEAE